MFRAYARFGVVVQLMAVLLAGIGVDRLLRSGARSARFACLALVVLVAGEYAVSPSTLWRDVLPTTAHRWIARQPARLRVLDCTLLSPASASADEWLMGGRVSTPGGPIADCAEPGLPGKLAALGYTHLLVRSGSWESRWIEQHRPGGLAMQAGFGDADLLAVTATPPPVYTAEMTAFFPVERKEGVTWRWIGQDATWRVVNRSGRPIVATLDIETWALGGSRRLELLLDRREVSMLVVDEQRHTYRIGPLPLTPGGHELLFRAIDPPTVADDLLHNGDRRPLSFAFGAWRWTVPGEQS
jgi:hypothetical protein